MTKRKTQSQIDSIIRKKDIKRLKRIREGQDRAKAAAAKKKRDKDFIKKRESRKWRIANFEKVIKNNRKRKARETQEARVRRDLKKKSDKAKKRQASADRRAVPKSRRIGGFLLKHAKQSKKKRRW